MAAPRSRRDPARDAPETDAFALGSFLARWQGAGRHPLAASDSETLSLSALLALADADDRARWDGLGLGYADPRGAPWLRAAIAARHGSADGRGGTGLAPLEAADVLCCAGAQEALTCAMRALLAPADHAVVVLPIYQPSECAATACCAATGVALEEGGPAPDGRGGRWRLDVDRVAAALRPNTRLVLTNFPNSPTGARIDAATLGALIALCRRHGLWLVNDEVYRLTACDAPAPPVADLYERGLSIDGLSKGFGLPGLRVGWAACRDRDVLAAMLRVKSGLSSCLASGSEVLARVALRAEARIVGRTRAIGARNHERLRMLTARHPDRFEPDPAQNLAFAFPRVLGAEGADRLALRLAREAGLLVLPGSLWRSALGPVPLDRVRIGLGHCDGAGALDVLEDALDAGDDARDAPEDAPDAPAQRPRADATRTQPSPAA